MVIPDWWGQFQSEKYTRNSKKEGQAWRWNKANKCLHTKISCHSSKVEKEARWSLCLNFFPTLFSFQEIIVASSPLLCCQKKQSISWQGHLNKSFFCPRKTSRHAYKKHEYKVKYKRRQNNKNNHGVWKTSKKVSFYNLGERSELCNFFGVKIEICWWKCIKEDPFNVHLETLIVSMTIRCNLMIRFSLYYIGE